MSSSAMPSSCKSKAVSSRARRLTLDDSHQCPDSTTVSNAINYTDIAVLTVVTALVARYMAKLQADIAPIVVYERRKRRQAGSVNPSPGTLEEGDAGPLNVLPLHEHSVAPTSTRVPSPSLKGMILIESIYCAPGRRPMVHLNCVLSTYASGSQKSHVFTCTGPVLRTDRARNCRAGQEV
jgi:hypothetical protein